MISQDLVWLSKELLARNIITWRQTDRVKRGFKVWVRGKEMTTDELFALLEEVDNG